ncbi:MAG: PaaX family transcriptional regulator [Myxococcota bacterium]
MTPSAKSLILDLLSTLPPRHPVPVGALVRAGAIFGLGENSLRVALARLRARGLVESDERGLYRLGAAAHAVNQQVRSWRTVEDAVCPWDGSWVAVEPGELLRGDRAAVRRREGALRLLGFRAWAGRLALRPNNLLGGVEAARERLDALGVGPRALVFRLSELDAVAEGAARALWHARALEAGYEAMRARLETSAARLPTLSRKARMAESFRLGGEAVRQIVLDPLLPAPIVAAEKRGALVEAMRRYDRLGRRMWRGWAGDSIELEQSPGDTSGLAAAGATPAAAQPA